jgi:hypothetical protein
MHHRNFFKAAAGAVSHLDERDEERYWLGFCDDCA